MIFPKSVAAALAACMCATTVHAASFYFHAHPDDIELFMARQAQNDIATGAKVVLILTTEGNGNPPQPDSYYQARKQGHDAAIKTWLHLRGINPGNTYYSYVNIGGKSILKGQVGGAGFSNVVTYFINLQDGSLLDFQQKSLTNPYYRVATVDGGASYTWIELKSFIIQLIQAEQDGNRTWINIPEFGACDAQGCYNGDHNDHNITGMVVTHALQDYARGAPSRCLSSVSYIGYGTGTRPINYDSTNQTWQRNAWTALNAAITSWGYATEDESWHDQFLYKQYTSDSSPYNYYGPC